MTLTRIPLDDALTCISCGVPHTIRALDPSHVISRARDPSRVDDPSNIVRQCRLCHNEIEPNGTARHRVEDGVYTYEKWSEKECDFVVVRQVKVKVDKRRGHLLEAESPAADRVRAGGSERLPTPPALSEGNAPNRSPRQSVAGPSASGKSSAAEGACSSKEERLVDNQERVGSNPTRPLNSAAEPLSGAAEGGAPVSGVVQARPVSAAPLPFDVTTWKEQGAGLLEMEETIFSAAQAIQFAKGDWFLDGEQHLGEEVYGHLDAIRSPSGKTFKPRTLMQYIWVAKNVASDTRVLTRDWTDHRTVAHLPAPKQKEWLASDLVGKKLYQAIHGERPKVKRWNLDALSEALAAFADSFEGSDSLREGHYESVTLFLSWLEAK